ncbi:hypothetical protein Acr_11g0005210 [Actinidia rufa]|uniref:Cytoplasmic tRNA 2-thiolation protein 2 n=1 Tax=Actinidia rufa TaxID=165716 RepID=A0A7J0FC12_9ERIC|nr:hypothetical protein Acr_11g0005210 [Actinidia rufa]
MACGSGGSCQSGCYKGEEEDQHSQKKESANGVATSGDDVNNQDLCVKCKSNETIATANPAAAAIASGGDGGRFCAECFRSNLFGKFRFAVTSNAMISPSDNALVAFSGGTSSRNAIYVLDLNAAFGELGEKDKRIPFYHVGDGHDRLKELVNAVSDVTGKDDLLLHLRMLSLQKIARQNGYTKLVLGSCTSMIACHVLAATVKGSLNVVKVLHNPHSGINGLVSSFVKLLQGANTRLLAFRQRRWYLNLLFAHHQHFFFAVNGLLALDTLLDDALEKGAKAKADKISLKFRYCYKQL